MNPSTIKVHELGQSFYVPSFTVTIAGRKLPDPVVRDVIDLQYSDGLEKIDSFALTLNNWDASTHRPKYEPAGDSGLEGLFDPGETLEISMGYVGQEQLMLMGEITTLEPRFPQSGALTLSVRGLNRLHRFRTEQHSFSWEETTDSEIAIDLGRRPARDGQPGLGIEVRTNPGREPTEPYVFMDNQYDIVFLLQRARKRGYELVLRLDEDGTEYLYFGPSQSKREPPVPYELEWGRSLLSFTPTLSTANQIFEVEVRGWDRRANRAISEIAKLVDEVPDSERPRIEALAQAFGNRREVITDRPVHTSQQAESMAKERLLDQSKQMVTATGTVIGLPDLRAGRKVKVIALGDRFDGEYFVTETTHTIGGSGYQTEFKARREGSNS